MTDCGGCQNLGAHRRHCPHHPDYHPWQRMADMAEEIGDVIGSNDVGIANTAYQLSERIRALIEASRPSGSQNPVGG